MIREVREGERPSASHTNKIIQAVNREFVAPNAISGPDGYALVSGRGGLSGGPFTLAVLRELDIGNQLAKMQDVAYTSDPNEQKLDGEVNFYKHVIAVDEIYEVIPPPTATFQMFNVQDGAALRPIEEASDPEDLSAAILWLVMKETEPLPWAWMWIKPKPQMGIVIVSGS